MKNNQSWQVFLQSLEKASKGAKGNNSQNSNSQISGIGVDVAKDKLDICLLLSSSSNLKSESKFIQISNIQSEINLFFKLLKKLKFKGKIVLEPTSIYHLSFYETGLKNDFSLVLCNPQKAKHFSRFLQGKKKSDKTDSLVLAKLAASDFLDEINQNILKNSKFESSNSDLNSNSNSTSKLKKLPNKNQLLINQLRSLNKTKQVLTGQLRHMQNLVNLSILKKSELKNIEKALESIENQIKLIEEKIEAEVSKNFDKEKIEKLQEIPGVSKRVASLLLALFNPSYSLSSWLGYTGSCPENQQSGTSLNKNGSISKKGNRMLRILLYHMGFGAGVHKYGFFRKMYERLKEKGRHHLEATLIVGKKVLRIFYAVLTKNVSFNPNIAKPV